MDNDSAKAIRVLECIAACNEQLIDLFLWLGSLPHISTRSHDLYCRSYTSGTMFEFYVEADLGGKVLCWWLDVSWDRQKWLIHSSVLVNENDDRGENAQKVLKEFPDRTPQTLEGFIEQLKEATSDLIAYARSMDLLIGSTI